jgi:hypothetical protein
MFGCAWWCLTSGIVDEWLEPGWLIVLSTARKSVEPERLAGRGRVEAHCWVLRDQAAH